MPKQKTIPELETEIAAKERQLAQLQHRQQQLEKPPAATTRKATAVNGRTASSHAARPSKA